MKIESLCTTVNSNYNGKEILMPDSVRRKIYINLCSFNAVIMP